VSTVSTKVSFHRSITQQNQVNINVEMKVSLVLFAGLLSVVESSPAASHVTSRVSKAPAVGRRSAAAAIVSEVEAPDVASAAVVKAGRGGAVAAVVAGEWPPAVKLLFGVGGIYGAFM